MARTLINVPQLPGRGEVIESRALPQHTMAMGYHPVADGKLLPRHIVRHFSCRLSNHADKELAFGAELFPATIAMPDP